MCVPTSRWGTRRCPSATRSRIGRPGHAMPPDARLPQPSPRHPDSRRDAPLDWGDMAYDFGDHREAVAMDRHLEDALA